MTFGRSVSLFACVLATSLTPVIAEAADPADEVAAETLYTAGRELMVQQRYEEACAKFDASRKLSPGIGVTMWLGECLEKSGLLASAWVQFKNAASDAARVNDRRAELATSRANALEPRLPRLLIRRGDFRGTVYRNGTELPSEAIDLPTPMDPGRYTFSFVREDGSRSERIIDVSAEAATIEVSIPPASPPVTEHRDSSSGARPSERAIDDKPAVARIVGFSLLGSSLLLAGSGSFFGVKAWGQRNEANEQHCSGNVCDPRGIALREDAFSSATASTVSFVLAGAALAAGILLVSGIFEPKSATGRP